MLADDQLHWGYLEEEDFEIGPNYTGLTKNLMQRQIASNISQTADKNAVVVAVTEKTRLNTGGAVTPGNTDIISRSSATRRNYSRLGAGSYLGNAQYAGTKWKLYKCKEC